MSAVLMTEHAKLLLPLIIPREPAQNGPKVVLLLLFFGANDATLKEQTQHVPSIPSKHVHPEP